MSAATMLSCGANSILMGEHSHIGPIDPQIVVRTQLGTQLIPAQAILDQFDMAREETSAKKASVWFPILPQYGPALLVQCKNAQDLSKMLVEEWLSKYMFNGDEDPNLKQKIKEISTFLANHRHLKSHSRFINRNEAEKIGLKIERLEDNTDIQKAVLSAFHAYMLNFSLTPAVKIIENHLGRAFIRHVRIQP